MKKNQKKILLPFKNVNTCFSFKLLFLSSNYFAVDTASAIAIALMTFGTMYPMSVYSGKVLLQVRQCHKARGLVVSVLLHVLIFFKHKGCFKPLNRMCSQGNL